MVQIALLAAMVRSYHRGGVFRPTLFQSPCRSFCSCFGRFLRAVRIRGFTFAASSFVLQLGNLHEVVGKYRSADP